MRNLFALYGKAECGKSESIKTVFDLLKSKYPSANVNVFFDEYDIKVIMTGINGLVIGIESCGDPNSRLKQSLEDFENAGCDIIFCASRTRGMTVNWVNSHSGKYSIDWTQQNYISGKSAQTTNNKHIAQTLIKKANL